MVRIRERLRAVYGVPLMRPHGHPIAELVLTVLSQSTNDRNRDVAYLRLRERMPTWEAVMLAPVAQVEEAIRPGGISKVKSARIQAILRAIAEDPRDPPNSLSLDWLPRVPLPEARDYLIALPGVGRKTAACVLLFAYGLHDVPVDTHVSRVGTRLGLLAPRGSLPAAARRDARADPAAARSSSCTSTSCATAGAPVMRAGRPAGSVPCGGCAPAAISSLSRAAALRTRSPRSAGRRPRSRARGRPRGSRTPAAPGPAGRSRR